MGVGTTGEAALKNNRRFIGIDIDEKYVKASLKKAVYILTFLMTSKNTKVDMNTIPNSLMSRITMLSFV